MKNYKLGLGNEEGCMNFENVDINLFKIFYLVCQYGNFSKAAENIGVTQPSISYSIKTLEEQLNIKLFNRLGYSLALTPEAEILLSYVSQALNSIKVGISNINDLINLNKGQISIGVPSHIGVFLLTDIIKKFNKIYPNVKIRVICKPTKELFKLLNDNELELLIDSSPLEDNIFNFELYKITHEKCAFACSKNSDLKNKVVSLKEIATYPLIVPSRTSSSTKRLIDIFDKKRVKFDPMFEISTSDMIAEMVEKDLGVGYLFEKTIGSYNNIFKVNLDTSLSDFDIFLIHKKEIVSVTAQEFINFIKNKYN